MVTVSVKWGWRACTPGSCGLWHNLYICRCLFGFSTYLCFSRVYEGHIYVVLLGPGCLIRTIYKYSMLLLITDIIIFFIVRFFFRETAVALFREKTPFFSSRFLSISWESIYCMLRGTSISSRVSLLFWRFQRFSFYNFGKLFINPHLLTLKTTSRRSYYGSPHVRTLCQSLPTSVLSLFLVTLLSYFFAGRFSRCGSTNWTLLRGYKESRTGLFSWCVISSFYFPWYVNLRKLFFMTRDLKVLRDPWRTWIINQYSWFHHPILHDFETHFL